MDNLKKDQNKNIIIAILVAYVVIDLLLPFLSGSKYCSLLEEITKNINNSGTLISIGVGLVVGFLVYNFLKN